jgi:hypothetical protein
LKHYASERFWALYGALPSNIRGLADKNYQLLKSDPKHPSLHFKRIGDLWSVRIGLHHRAGLGMGAKPIAGFAPIESVAAVPYLRDGGRRGYADFLTRLAPRAFAIAPNGAWGFSGPVTPIYNARARERFDPIENALERCNKRGEGKCRLYAIDGRVVWRGDL